MSNYHIPVLLKESIDFLDVKQGKKYIDATLGGGGHTLEIIKRGGIVLGIDVDEEAIEHAKVNFKLRVAQGNFKDINIIAIKNGFESVAGVIFDLGVSSHQLDMQERGFSFQNNGPLDMRMDKSLTVTAADLVNGLTRKELYELFTTLGQEFNVWPIVHNVIRSRRVKQIQTTRQLAEIVRRATTFHKGRIHPATKVFQALRIAVNDELGNLKRALSEVLNLFENKGRIVVISFHSLEDGIVKDFFKKFEKEKEGKIITDKPIVPSEIEIEKNPRSRSAKMRVFEKF